MKSFAAVVLVFFLISPSAHAGFWEDTWCGRKLAGMGRAVNRFINPASDIGRYLGPEYAGLTPWQVHAKLQEEVKKNKAEAKAAADRGEFLLEDYKAVSKHVSHEEAMAIARLGKTGELDVAFYVKAAASCGATSAREAADLLHAGKLDGAVFLKAAKNEGTTAAFAIGKQVAAGKADATIYFEVAPHAGSTAALAIAEAVTAGTAEGAVYLKIYNHGGTTAALAAAKAAKAGTINPEIYLRVFKSVGHSAAMAAAKIR